MNKPLNVEFDVVVIGGGVSGFTSAFTITQKDPALNLLLVEETHKVGGNPMSDARSYEFISGANHYLSHILTNLQLTPIQRTSSGTVLSELEPGEITCSDEDIPLFASYLQRRKFEYFLAKIEILCEQISLSSPMGSLESKDLDNITMEEYIQNNLSYENLRNYMRTIVQTNCGVQAKDMSALFYIAYCHSSGGVKNQFDRSLNGPTGYFLENASMEICSAIQRLEAFSVHLNERVKAVWREFTSITVITDRKRYKCLHVVVAIPPDRVLLLDIKPSLTESRRSILNEMSYNLVETTVINHDVPEESSGDIICSIEENNSIQRSIGLKDVHSLFLYLYCNDFDKMQNQLKRYFGDGTGDVEECLHLYTDDDYHSFRVAAVPALRDLRNFHEIRRPLYRLFWAGNHTSTIWYGHLEGSVYTGIRAGIELLYDYKPQVLDRHDIILLTNKPAPLSIFKDGKLNQLLRYRTFYYKFTLFATLILIGVIYKKLWK